MKTVKWYECEIPVEEIAKGVLLSFQREMARAFDLAGWPAGAAVFASAGDGEDNTKIWLTEKAVKAAEAAGFLWKQYFVKELDKPPIKSRSTLLLGHQDAWDLLIQE